MVDGHLPGAPAAPDGGRDWAAISLAKARADLAAAGQPQRSVIAARLAAVLVSCAHDEEADAVLAEARRDAARLRDPEAVARVELALASAAQIRDDDARASMHLKLAIRGVADPSASLAAAAWLIDARLARVQGRGAPTLHFDPRALEGTAGGAEALDLAAELAIERAAVARDAQEWSVASGHLAHARELIERSGSPRFAALFELEAGQFAAEAGDFQQGRTRMRTSIDVFASCGLRREEGRAIIRYAELVAANAVRAPEESAPAWLGRAQAVLGTEATWRDRLWIRTGFRNFGRRVIDRVMTEGTVARIEAFERARGALLSALSVSAEASDAGLTEIELSVGAAEGNVTRQLERMRLGGASGISQTAQAIGEVDGAVRDLIDLIGAALVERDRLRVLINVLQEIDAVSDPAALAPLAARLAARVLEADHVVLATVLDGELVESGRFGEPLAGSGAGWRAAAAAATRDDSGRPRSDPSQLAARAEQNLCGPVLAVPLRGSGVGGVLYADKLRRAGQFRDQDYAIAHLLADYVSLALGRLHAREQERVALRQLAVTLDAIRDGVIACDERGVITSMNAAAARMLRVGHDELVGAQIPRVASLAPLHALLSQSPRVDGAVIRLAHGSFVVTARPIGDGSPLDLTKTSDGDGGGGFVATLVELDRAQKIAQRITATRARYGFNDIIGTSAPLQAAISMARRAALIDASVLITGESGTGKEVIAQAIHTAGPRSAEPFVGINVAALPRDLLEAELFGYEKGAFTGARTEGNAGKFELAGEGTILLDEIGDMPLDMQAKLLRVLQERVVTRLGGQKEIPMHARVIATTHRDLEQLVDEGKFRMDLLYRLRVLAIELPPLRDRPEDIVLLAQQHLVRFAEQQRKRVRALGPRVLDELDRYDWPGNVRELANVMEAEVSLAAADIEVLDRLATRLVGRFRVPGAASTGEWRAVPPLPIDEPILPLAEVEKKAFLHALDHSNQSIARASEALGVSKVTFYAKLRSWGMHPKDEGPASARWSTRTKVDEDGAESSRKISVRPTSPPGGRKSST